jgi:hypothetical protein
MMGRIQIAASIINKTFPTYQNVGEPFCLEKNVGDDLGGPVLDQSPIASMLATR